MDLFVKPKRTKALKSEKVKDNIIPKTKTLRKRKSTKRSKSPRKSRSPRRKY